MEEFDDLTMEEWKVGRLERWNGGKMEGWKIGKMERWNGGKMEDFTTEALSKQRRGNGRMECWKLGVLLKVSQLGELEMWNKRRFFLVEGNF